MGFSVGKDGKTWRLFLNSKDKTQALNKKSSEARSVGFRPEMTYEEAKAWANQLKAQSKATALKAREINKAITLTLIRSAFVSDEDVRDFESKKLPALNLKIAHWKSALEICTAIPVHPSEWGEQYNKIYEVLLQKRFSPDYCTRMIRILNAWGAFVCRKHGRLWEPVPHLKGVWRKRVKETYRRKIGGNRDVRRSKPLTPEMLKQGKQKLQLPQYLWLMWTVHFGLRPLEVDSLYNPELTIVKDNVLHVFQEKLKRNNVAEERCWKHIPVKTKEQRLLLQSWERRDVLTRPTYKTLRTLFGPQVTHYAGRKGFVTLLADMDYDLETCSSWMGHLSLAETQAAYQDFMRVNPGRFRRRAK